MIDKHILVVEDDGIIGNHLKRILSGMGYVVPDAVSTGEEAIQKAAEMHPDLVLMDIELAGEMNGIKAAEYIRTHMDTPVIYLTAYSDDAALQRARITEPYGYLIKPVQDRELKASIAMALYRAQMERRLKESEERYRTVVEDQTEAICRFKANGQFTFVNGAFCRQFGGSSREWIGKNFFNLVSDENRPQVIAGFNALSQQTPINTFEEEHVLAQGEQRWYQWAGRAIFDTHKQMVEIQAMGRDVTEQRRAEALHRHDVILEAVSFASKCFLQPSNWDQSVPKVLARLGQATRVSRVRLFENRTDEKGSFLINLRLEWTDSAITTEFQDQPNNPMLLPDWPALAASLSKGQVVWTKTAYPALITPIFAGEEWWGLIEYGDCTIERNWLPAEIDALQVAAEIWGTAIQHKRELDALARLSAALRTATVRAEMLPIVLKHLQELLKVRGAAAVMQNAYNSKIVVELASGDWKELSGLHLTAAHHLIHSVIQTGQPCINYPVRSCTLAERASPSNPHSWICMNCTLMSKDCMVTAATNNDIAENISHAAVINGIPLITQSHVIGALWLERSRPLAETDLRLLNAIADMVANAIQRVSLYEQTRQRLQRLSALQTIDTTINASLNLDLTLNVLLTQAATQLGVDAAAVSVLNPRLRTLKYAAGYGFRAINIENLSIRLGDEPAGLAVLEQRIIQTPDPAVLQIAESPAAKFAMDQDVSPTSFMRDEAFIISFAAPLIAKGHVKGVLEVFHRSTLDPDSEWLTFLETLAGQAAIAIDNIELFKNLERSNLELSLAYDTTLEGWARALELRDKETEGHTRRVVDLTMRLATAMGIDEVDLIHIRRGALLHDIGKMAIPDAILLKPGPLTDEEWVIMRQHPLHAFNMLRSIAYIRPALEIPYCHHEKWDGSGYPQKLRREQIPISARIFAVVDVWDAIRSDRPYRIAMPKEKAQDLIRQQANTHFDPLVVEAFFRLEN